jgi:Fur family peroxide stress response transcriptional regulator
VPEADEDRQVREFIARCRGNGIRVTPQRVAVFRELAATAEHPSAKVIHERVSQHMPSISLDTVYRTLDKLEAKGLVTSVSTPESTARYDARTESHYHFVCRRCKRVVDVTTDDLEAFEPPDNAARYGRIDSVTIQLRGCCSDCIEQQGDPVESS